MLANVLAICIFFQAPCLCSTFLKNVDISEKANFLPVRPENRFTACQKIYIFLIYFF